MDFRFSEREEAFRGDVREFLRRELPPGWEGGLWVLGTEEGQALTEGFNKKVAARGWVGLQWPREYGGLGASPMEGLILEEEMGYHKAPVDVNLNSWVGGTLIVHGTEEQKKRYLPGLISCDTQMCVGYTEPEAGSDLFALKTSAVEEDNCYLINGQKMFTSAAHKADYCWLAVRTDTTGAKHRGLSIFIVDMRTPGITVRPLYDLLGMHHLNEVFFDGVRAPKECLIGEKNQGLLPILTELDIERAAFGGGIYNVAWARRALDEMVEMARGRGGADPLTRHKLAERAVEIEVARLLAYHVTWLATRGTVPHHEASASKLFGSELSQRLTRTVMEIAGLGGMLMRSSPWAPMDGRLPEDYLFKLIEPIGAGTSEIMRNIVAGGLGLPTGG